MKIKELSIKKDNILVLFSFTVILFFHFLLRLKDIKNFSIDKNPLSGYDGYYYAFLSKQILNKVYTNINYYVNVPDFAVNMHPPPLISLIPVWLYDVFKIPLEKNFFILPAIFSIFFAFSLYFWLRTFINNNFIIFIILTISSLVITLNPIYYARTTVGRNDTDSLILFFIFLIYAFFNLSIKDKSKEYLYLFLAGISFDVFMWWYYKPIFSLIFVISLIILLLLNKENIKLILVKVIIFIFITNPLIFFESLKAPFFYLFAYLLKTNVNTSTFEPPIPVAINIIELQNVSFNDFVKFTTGNFISILLSVIGILFFVKNYFKYTLPLIPIFFIGISTFLGGNRFIIYLAPFIGIGIAYFSYISWLYLNKFIKTNVLKYLLGSFLFPVITFISISPFTKHLKAMPLISDDVYNKLLHVKEYIDKDGYVYSWWGWGNIVRYILDRGTFISNMNFNPYKIYGFSKILMTDNEEKAIYTTGFLTNNLQINYKDKIKNINDFDKIITEAKTLPNKKVYFVIFNNTFKDKYIYTLAHITNNTKKITLSSPVKLFFKCFPSDKDKYDCGIISYDKLSGNYNIKDNNTKKFIYKIIKVRKDLPFTLREENPVNKNGIYTVELVELKDSVFIVVINKDFENSIINRMFVLEDEFKYFSKTYSDFPYFVVYETK